MSTFLTSRSGGLVGRVRPCLNQPPVRRTRGPEHRYPIAVKPMIRSGKCFASASGPARGASVLLASDVAMGFDGIIIAFASEEAESFRIADRASQV